MTVKSYEQKLKQKNVMLPEHSRHSTIVKPNFWIWLQLCLCQSSDSHGSAAELFLPNNTAQRCKEATEIQSASASHSSAMYSSITRLYLYVLDAKPGGNLA